MVSYIFSAVIAIVICSAVLMYEYVGLSHTKLYTVRFLCDGFFISGIIFLSSGCLLFVSNNGGFTALTYGFSVLFSRFRSPRKYGKETAEKRTYSDYVRERTKQRLSAKPLFVVGTVCVFVSILLLVVFERLAA